MLAVGGIPFEIFAASEYQFIEFVSDFASSFWERLARQVVFAVDWASQTLVRKMPKSPPKGVATGLYLSSTNLPRNHGKILTIRELFDPWIL